MLTIRPRVPEPVARERVLGNPWSEVAIVSGAAPWRTGGRPPYEALEQTSVAATLLLFKFLDSMALIGAYLAR